MKKTLVIPSCRVDSLARFFKTWESKGGWDDIILVEDRPTRSTLNLNLPVPITHYSHQEIKEITGDNSWIFSKGDSAIRCFGYLAAYGQGADYVLTLDDDCYPVNVGVGNFFEDHIAAMENLSVWEQAIPGQRTRGLPYEEFGHLPASVINVGLWTQFADYDAITEVKYGNGGYCPPPWLRQRIIPNGNLFPMSGMNLCIAKKALPLLYYPLMGEGQPYKRFDDIWAGIIAKLTCDKLGWNVSVGTPYVKHLKASDPKDNLEKEAPGVGANEWFWKEIKKGFDRLENSFRNVSSFSLLTLLGYYLEKSEIEYIQKLGSSLRVWAKLIDEAEVLFNE